MPTIPLDQLDSHPDNANVMPAALFRKLVRHIETGGRYPPLIVRPAPDSSDVVQNVSHDVSHDHHRTPRYQILDGHHRAKALRQLGRESAECMVWDVDDEQADLLLLTLNRLHGEDDPQRRGALLERAARSLDLKSLA